MSCQKELGVEDSKTNVRLGIVYLINDDTPYTGRIHSKYQNGQISMIGQFKSGKKSGQWIGWYENGQKESVEFYKDGLLDGKWIIYSQVNGNKFSERHYDGGIETGIHTLWYHNGNIRQTGFYKNGLKVGNWTYYNEDGSVNNIEDYGGGD